MIRSAFATLGVLLLSIAAYAAPIDLGVASDYNVFTFGNLGDNAGFHIVGRIAVGGNVNNGFSVGPNDPVDAAEWTASVSTPYYAYIKGNIGDKLSVNLTGSASPSVAYAGSKGHDSFLNAAKPYIGKLPEGYKSIEFDLPYFIDLSKKIAGLKDYGGAVINGSNDSGWTLNATAPFTVINMSQKQFENLHKISVPDTSTLLINVDGNVINRGTAFSMKINDDGEVKTVNCGNILFNFRDATSISTGTTIYGSILAPQATLNGNQNLKGQIIVGTLASSGEIHAARFTGEYPPVSTPEPSTMLLMGSGLLGIWNLRKRMFRG